MARVIVFGLSTIKQVNSLSSCRLISSTRTSIRIISPHFSGVISTKASVAPRIIANTSAPILGISRSGLRGGSSIKIKLRRAIETAWSPIRSKSLESFEAANINRHAKATGACVAIKPATNSSTSTSNRSISISSRMAFCAFSALRSTKDSKANCKLV